MLIGVAYCWFVGVGFWRCFGVCYFVFTLIVLVRLVLLPLM